MLNVLLSTQIIYQMLMLLVYKSKSTLVTNGQTLLNEKNVYITTCNDIIRYFEIYLQY